MPYQYILITVLSCFFLAISSRLLINALSRIAKYLGWKEFVVAFFMMAFASSLPNLFVGIIAALNKIPELSLGDVIGGNIADTSLIIGLSALVSRMGLSAQSRTVQGSSIFTILIAVLPLFLVSDGALTRGDGVILLLSFFVYSFWLFKKRERFEKIYDGINEKMTLSFFLKNFFVFLVASLILVASAYGLVKSSGFFASFLGLPVTLIGILIVGIGNSLPELFFSLQAARKGQDWLILGNIMGGVVILSTLVLGTVVLISPIQVSKSSTLSSILIGRIFLIISSLFFLIFIRTNRKITRKEAVILILIYFVFVLFELLNQI